MSKLFSVLAAGCLAAAIPLAHAERAPAAKPLRFQWTFVELATLGGNVSWATGINDSGDVVGWSGVVKGPYTDLDPEFHAFVYSNGEMRDLGRAGSNSAARAINRRGQVAGTDAAGVSLWSNGAAAPLAFRGTPNSINSYGTIAGTYDGAGGEFRGFIYRGGHLVEMATLGGGFSHAAAINDRDTVVGGAATASGTVHAFAFMGGVMRDLGTLGGPNSQAYGVNGRDVVVGSAGNATDGVEAFIHDGVLRPLFPAKSPQDVSEAYAINDRNQVVGVINEAGFLWDNGKLTMLRDLLTEEQKKSWGVLTPLAINQRGWIAGVASTEGVNGIPGGYRRAFILKPTR